MAMPRGNGRPLRIEGLREFNTALKRLEDKYPEQVKKANYEVAERIAAVARMNALRSPNGSLRKQVDTIRAGKAANEASIRMGNKAKPWAFGAEFGAYRFKQFERWRGNRWESWDGGPGYIIHPAIRDQGERVLEDYKKALAKIEADAFPD